ncbi:MAG: TonB-dependent receptor [Lysobacteraceae bacterium]
MRLSRLACVMVASAFFPSLALAQQHTTLEAIQVSSATRTALSLDQTPYAVEVIDEAEIQRSAATTLRDVLEMSSAVFVNPWRGDISIRGAGARGTLLLIDGRRLAGESTAMYELNRIPAGRIERIDIVKGPMSVLYGSDAAGGLINIITKAPAEPTQGSLGLNTGSNSQGQGAQTTLDGDVRGTRGALAYAAWFTAQDANDYSEREQVHLRVPRNGSGGQVLPSQSEFGVRPDGRACLLTQPACATAATALRDLLPDALSTAVSYREPAQVWSLGTQLGWLLSEDWHIGLDGSWLDEHRDSQWVNASHPSAWLRSDGLAAFPLFNVPTRTQLDNRRWDVAFNTRWHATPSLQMDARIYRSQYRKDEAITALDWPLLGYTSESASASTAGRGEVRVDGMEWMSTWVPSPAHTLMLGLDRRDESRTTAFYNTLGIPETRDYRFDALFAQHDWAFGKRVRLVYGLRQDELSTGQRAVTGRAGLRFNGSTAFNWRFSVGEGFRAPDLAEAFLNRTLPQGRVVGAAVVDSTLGKLPFELVPETSLSKELGVDGKIGSMRYELAIYRNEINDRIEQVVESPLGVPYRTYRNTGKARIEGVESSLQWRASDGLTIGGHASWMDAKNRNSGQRLEFQPEMRANVFADCNLSADWSARVAWRYVGRQSFVDTRSGQAVASVTSAFHLVDLRLAYAAWSDSGWDLSVGAENLFDEEIDSILGSSVGTWWYLGVRRYW